MRNITFTEIALKSVVVHTATYFVMGLLALFAFDYATYFQQPGVREYMRPLDHPLVMAGVLFQPARGLLFAIAFHAVRHAVFTTPDGWFRLWLVLVTVGVLSTFGAAPGSIEGMIYSSWPLRHHIGLGLVEVGGQALLLSLGLYFWIVYPAMRWLRYTMLTVFVAALLLPTVGLLATKTASPSALIGTWVATSANASGSSFVFREDGTATWMLGQPFEIRFRIDSAPAPSELDLYDFQSGPLRGRTLYCLIAISDAELRMDCEPTTRPTGFDAAQTQVFTRSVAPSSSAP